MKPVRLEPALGATSDRRRSLCAHNGAWRVTLEEIRDAIQDEGYSGDRRKALIKEVLTEVACRPPCSSESRRLIVEIEAVVIQLSS